MNAEQEAYFSKRTPLPSNSSISVDTDGGILSISIFKGDDVNVPEEIAWSAPDANKKDVIWFAMSAAAFHNIPCYMEDAVLDLPETL